MNVDENSVLCQLKVKTDVSGLLTSKVFSGTALSKTKAADIAYRSVLDLII